MFFAEKYRHWPHIGRRGAARRGGKAGALFGLALAILLPFRVPAQTALPPAGGALKVVVSLKPLHSLVSAVMQDAGAPQLIVQGAGSEHGYQLRPQDAKNLGQADIVFWAGPQMEQFLQKPLQNLSPKAEIIALAEAPGVMLLPARAGGSFEPHDHSHGIAAGAEARTATDWHFWLDPQNAKAAVAAIEQALAAKDPTRAALYHKNAEAYRQRLDRLTAAVAAECAPLRGRPFIVFHDAYQYFERRFDMPAIGSVTVNPEQAPGARRVALLRAKIAALSAAARQGQNGFSAAKAPLLCVFSEPQFEPKLAQVLVEGTNAKTGELDPLGIALPSGPGQYIALIQNLADSLKHCLSGG